MNTNELKIFYIKQLAERVAKETELLHKCFSDNTTFKAVLNSSMDQISFSQEELEEVKKIAKIVLKYEYNLEVISEVPLIINNLKK